MERAAVLGRLSWITAEVVGLIEENPNVMSIVLRCPGWPGHQPGQHVDVRLTGEDGYQAQRSYSIASAESAERVTITVELIAEGEVSPYLVHQIAIGDQLEIRGPIGGYFVWTPAHGGPLQLIAGGSGLVPFMAMIRSLAASNESIPVRLLVSARTWESMIYRDELERLTTEVSSLSITYTLSRSHPEDWHGYERRVDKAMLSEVAWPSTSDPLIYVCGPTGLVEAAASDLVALGHRPEAIKTERFGPSGG